MILECVNGAWPVHEDHVAVGASGVRALENDAARVAIVFANGGATDITLSPHNAPVSGQGILLPAGAPPLLMTIGQQFTLLTHEWYAIGSAAAGKLTVLSVTIT